MSSSAQSARPNQRRERAREASLLSMLHLRSMSCVASRAVDAASVRVGRIVRKGSGERRAANAPEN